MLKVLEKNEVLEQVIAENPRVLVDFFATWCGPCKMMSPVLDDIAETTDILVVKVDVDQFQQEAAKEQIMMVPTLIAYQDGKEVNRTSGVLPKDEALNLFI